VIRKVGIFGFPELEEMLSWFSGNAQKASLSTDWPLACGGGYAATGAHDPAPKALLDFPPVGSDRITRTFQAQCLIAPLVSSSVAPVFRPWRGTRRSHRFVSGYPAQLVRLWSWKIQL
jgi:hypothetical protein